MDGTLQAAGGTLYLIGHLAGKKVLVGDDVNLRVVPMRIGTDYGVEFTGGF